MVNVYDGDRLRGKRTEGQAITYYLRSTVLGGQVVAELDQGWQLDARLRLFGRRVARGTMIGRVGAHEAIQHRLLGIGQEGLLKDISSSRITGRELRAVTTNRFNTHPLTAGILSGSCRR